MAGPRSSGNLRRFTFITNVEEESLIKTYRLASIRQNGIGQFEATFGLISHKLYIIRRACDGFDFLGFRYTIKKGKGQVKPSERNMNKFQSGFAKGMANVVHGPPSGECRARRIKDLRRYVHSWTKAFAPWPGSSRFRKKMLTEIPKSW